MFSFFEAYFDCAFFFDFEFQICGFAANNLGIERLRNLMIVNWSLIPESLNPQIP